MYLLVDYENVNYNGLIGSEYLSPEDNLIIFYSKPCRYIRNYRVQHILDSGCKFNTCKLVNKGKDALDFYIAIRVGEIFAGDDKAIVGIVSNDKGFKNVKDYWKGRLNPATRLVCGDTIETCIISSAVSAERKYEMAKNLERIEMESIIQEYRYRKKLEKIKKALCEAFENSEYKILLPQIIDIVENSNDHKTMYLKSLKSFGKEKGLDVYRQLKQVV